MASQSQILTASSVSMNGWHQCTDGAWLFRPEATILDVSDFAEGTVIDPSYACLPCALYDALAERRARIIAPNASGIRVPQPGVIGDRIRAAIRKAGEVAAQQSPVAHAAINQSKASGNVVSPFVEPSAAKQTTLAAPALPKKGQTLSMFGAAVMASTAPATSTTSPKSAAKQERVKATENIAQRASAAPRPVEDYGDFGGAPANDTRGEVDDKVRRRANIARLTAKKDE